MAFDDEISDKISDSHKEETELEQYGVWVKVGPEEISAEEEDSIEDDFELHDLHHEEAVEDYSELTDEEEQLLGELEEDIDNADIALDEEPAVEPIEVESEKLAVAENETEAEEIATEVEDIDIDDLTEMEEEDGTGRGEGSGDEDTGAEDEMFDIDIDEDLLLGTDDIEDLENLDIEGLLNEDMQELEEDVRGLENAEKEKGDFDDLEALEAELESEDELLDIEDLDSSRESASSAEPPHSVEILSKIEKELLSIKNELSSLKEELSSLRASKEPSSSPSFGEKEKPSDELSMEQEDTGFFDEDEDETIALTGDELDNILNTANFTEENGTEEIHPEDTEEEFNDFREGFSDEENSFEVIPEEEPEEISEELEEEETPGDSLSLEEEDLLIDQEDVLTEEDLTVESDRSDESIEVSASPSGEEEEILDFEDLGGLEDEEEDEIELEEEALPADEEEEETGSFELEDLETGELEGLAAEEEELEEIELGDLEENISGEATEEQLEENEGNNIEVLLPELKEEEQEEQEKEENFIDESEIESIDLEDFESPEEAPQEEISLEEAPLEEASFEESLEATEDLEEAEETGLEEGALEELDIEVPEESPEDEFLVSVEPQENLMEEEEILFDDTETIPGENVVPEMVAVTPKDGTSAGSASDTIPEGLKSEIKSVLSYMDQLLESLPEEKIQEFANSEHFEVYKRLFDELGLNS
jgi:hypothetical protein